MELKGSSIYRYTIGVTYYNEPEFLLKQIENWNLYPHNIQIILVDDGSEKYPAIDYVDKVTHPGFQLWKVTEDLGFNSHGCRNLIATIAEADTILFLDIDCLLSPENAAYLKKVKFNPLKVYRFNLYNAQKHKYVFAPGHINIFAINKNSFWQAGGYDESFVGHHYGDRDFHSELAKLFKEESLGNIGITMLRGGRKIVVDKNVDRTTYDDVRMILSTPEKLDLSLAGTIKTKLNFPYIKLL